MMPRSLIDLSNGEFQYSGSGEFGTPSCNAAGRSLIG